MPNRMNSPKAMVVKPSIHSNMAHLLSVSGGLIPFLDERADQQQSAERQHQPQEREGCENKQGVHGEPPTGIYGYAGVLFKQ
jgi:hypothetical protein